MNRTRKHVASTALVVACTLGVPAWAQAVDPCGTAARRDEPPAGSEPYQANASRYRLTDDAQYRLADSGEFRLSADTRQGTNGAPRCRVTIPAAAATPAAPGASAYAPVFREAAGGGPYHTLINKTAQSVGIQADLLHAVVTVESGYDAGAISPKGAQGLMQLMPSTAALYTINNPYDPAQNLRGGARYLRYLLGEFDNDLKLALAAYNAGPETVRKYNSIPPYPETRDYVQRVLRHYQQRLDRSSSKGY